MFVVVAISCVLEIFETIFIVPDLWRTPSLYIELFRLDDHDSISRSLSLQLMPKIQRTILITRRMETGHVREGLPCPLDDPSGKSLAIVDCGYRVVQILPLWLVRVVPETDTLHRDGVRMEVREEVIIAEICKIAQNQIKSNQKGNNFWRVSMNES